MSRVFWDTNIFIYLFEGSTMFAARAHQLREKMLARGDQLLTSTFSLGEILVQPARQKNSQLAQYYERLLPATSVLIPFDEKAASAYAHLRCDPSLRHPDAIQLACAACYGVDLFVTNDTRLHAKRVPGIQFIAPLDRVPI